MLIWAFIRLISFVCTHTRYSSWSPRAFGAATERKAQVAVFQSSQFVCSVLFCSGCCWRCGECCCFGFKPHEVRRQQKSGPLEPSLEARCITVGPAQTRGQRPHRGREKPRHHKQDQVRTHPCSHPCSHPYLIQLGTSCSPVRLAVAALHERCEIA